MGKGREWSDEDTVPLCLSWLETSEDPITGTGQKKDTVYSRVYQHWLEHKNPDTDVRSVIASSNQRKSDEVNTLVRPTGQKASKRSAQNSKNAMAEDIHMRFVIASEQKAAGKMCWLPVAQD
ncbi:hypothetical protein PInf_007090 [Phytophthora infestans]|nr:hypothetical protein PInf_007090 [Phytophthora infestans]